MAELASSSELVLDEGWARMWQTGPSPKGYRVHLADAGDGRYLLTNRRLIWYRLLPTSRFRSSGYSGRIEIGMRLYKENLIELVLDSVSEIAMKRWAIRETWVARFNLGSGEAERAFLCLDPASKEPADLLTNRLFELIKQNSTALDMTA